MTPGQLLGIQRAHAVIRAEADWLRELNAATDSAEICRLVESRFWSAAKYYERLPAEAQRIVDETLARRTAEVDSERADRFAENEQRRVWRARKESWRLRTARAGK